MVTSVFGISAILREVRRGGRGFPPSGTNEFADGYCVSEVRFARRTGSSAPTKFLKIPEIA